jgi:hypothetical protein
VLKNIRQGYHTFHSPGKPLAVFDPSQTLVQPFTGDMRADESSVDAMRMATDNIAEEFSCTQKTALFALSRSKHVSILKQLSSWLAIAFFV